MTRGGAFLCLLLLLLGCSGDPGGEPSPLEQLDGSSDAVSTTDTKVSEDGGVVQPPPPPPPPPGPVPPPPPNPQPPPPPPVVPPPPPNPQPPPPPPTCPSACVSASFPVTVASSPPEGAGNGRAWSTCPAGSVLDTNLASSFSCSGCSLSLPSKAINGQYVCTANKGAAVGSCTINFRCHTARFCAEWGEPCP